MDGLFGGAQLKTSRMGSATALEHADASLDELETLYVGLVHAYHAAIVHYVYSMVNDIQQAEDLAQDAFLKAYLALKRSGPPDNPRAWLYRIATNATIDHLRRQRRFGWVGLHRVINVLRSEDPSERVIKADPFERAMGALSGDQQTVLMLFARSGLKAPEVAEVLGISPAAARKRRQRAREAFMTHYQKEASHDAL
jgi:RNA polymerase sigma-70 factor (ECF subfamily)